MMMPKGTAMMMVEKLWADLLQQGDRPIYRRVDEVHPLDLYAGVDAESDLLIMLVCSQEPRESPAYDALDVRHNRRHDGRWALTIRLLQQDLAAPFARLCQDLIDQTRHGCDETDASDSILQSLVRWRRLMVLMRSGFSEAVARGLIGELLFLENTAIPRFGVNAAIRGWIGPEGGSQDFRVGGNAIEVKTCLLGSAKLAISSLDQLYAGDVPLYLVVVSVSPCSEKELSGITLNNLIARVRKVVENTVAGPEFEKRLADMGVDQDSGPANALYQVHGTRVFKVNGNFPCLRRSLLPAGIRDASYTIDLSACADFECELDFGHGTE